MMGFDPIMRMQTVITIIPGVLTVMFIILVAGKIHWSTVSALPGGSVQSLIGGLVVMLTGSSKGAEYLDRQRPDRGAGRPAADLVPGPVGDRGRARPHRRPGVHDTGFGLG